MKHFMLPRNRVLREPMEIPSSPNPTPSKSKQKHKKYSKENAPPPDPNYQPSPAATAMAKLKSPLPPRPPSSNPLKRKLYAETLPDNAVSGISDSGVKVFPFFLNYLISQISNFNFFLLLFVQVVVRVRPPIKEDEEGETIVQKITSDSLSINGQTLTFDSVANTDTTQALMGLFLFISLCLIISKIP